MLDTEMVPLGRDHFVYLQHNKSNPQVVGNSHIMTVLLAVYDAREQRGHLKRRFAHRPRVLALSFCDILHFTTEVFNCGIGEGKGEGALSN